MQDWLNILEFEDEPDFMTDDKLQNLVVDESILNNSSEFS